MEQVTLENFPASDEGEKFPMNKSKSKEVYTPSAQPETELYQLVYKHNKSFELHVKSEVIRFENSHVVFPQKYLGGFPAEILNDPDFKAQSDNFVVIKKGV